MTRLVKKQSASTEPDFVPTVRRMAALAADHKAEDIVAYDVRGVTLIADSFFVCSARSEPQMKAITNAIKEGLKEIGIAPLAVEGTTSSGWVVMDYGIIIVHVFKTEVREFYDLDGFWADAPNVDLDLPD